MIKNLTLFLLILVFSLSVCAADKIPFGLLKGCKNTMNFTVWAPIQKDAEAVAFGLEEYYKRFLRDLECGGMLKKKPQVYIFANYEDYVDKLGVLRYNTENTGGVAIPKSARKPAEIYSFLSDNLLDEVIPHELTHLLFREIVAGLRTNAVIPLWLNEGMAEYEKRTKRYKAEVKKALESGTLIPLSEVVGYTAYPADLNKNHLFYAESASIVEFLLTEYGGAKFTSFSRKLVSDRRQINEALFSTYYPQIRDASQLNDAWLRFLKQ